MSYLPGGKDVLIPNGDGAVVRLGGHCKCVGDVVRGRTGGGGAGVFEAVTGPADPPERAEDAGRGAELGDDSFLDGHVPATTGRTQSLDGEQARCALAQRVVGELIGPRQVPGLDG